MDIRDLTTATIEAHESVENLHRTIKTAVVDGRFRLTLEDARHFRDLVDDMELLLNEAWRGSLEIPLETKAIIKI